MTKADDDLMKFVIQRSTEKQPPLRDETMGERVQRYMFLYENGYKPEHYDDPLINKVDTIKDYGKLRKKAADTQDYRNMATGKPVSKEFIRDAYPKKFDHHDKSTYPSSQIPQGKISTWDLIKQTAKTPFEKREVRNVLNREYKKDKKRLEPDELKLIGKHPDQIKAQVEALSVIPDEIIKPVQKPIPTPTAIVDIYDVIKKRAQMKPGISEDLIKLQSDIRRNTEWVMGKSDDTESVKEINTTNTKETNDA